MPALPVRRGEPAFAATLVVAEAFLLIQLESESHRRKLARLQFFEEIRKGLAKGMAYPPSVRLG